MKITTRTLPAQWECFLLGGNLVATDICDRLAASAYLMREKLPRPAMAADQTRFQWSNDADCVPQGGQVLDFIFIIP